MKHIFGIICTALFLSLFFSSPVLAAGFIQDTGGVKYQNDDGTFAVNTFVQVTDKIYHLDENGYVQTGWIKAGDLWYFLDPDGICLNPWGESNPPEGYTQEIEPDPVSTEWTPYSTSDPATLANAIAKGHVIYKNGQYWASPEYVDKISNSEIVYIVDLSPAPIEDRFATANLKINW